MPTTSDIILSEQILADVLTDELPEHTKKEGDDFEQTLWLLRHIGITHLDHLYTFLDKQSKYIEKEVSNACLSQCGIIINELPFHYDLVNNVSGTNIVIQLKYVPGRYRKSQLRAVIKFVGSPYVNTYDLWDGDTCNASIRLTDEHKKYLGDNTGVFMLGESNVPTE
jgi:hypothetical protein